MTSVLRLKPGTIVGGDYKVGSLLAKGGMGAVYVAEQLSTECERALKVMHPELLDDAKARERFKQEARICSRIESEHVVKVIGSGIDEALGAPWLAMELIKGEDLQSFIKTRGALPRDEVLEMFRQMCHGLGAAHRMGVVHRDLKLQNILVAPPARPDSPFTVKVLDFGISKVLKEDAASDTTAAVGSPMWMAPEQAQKGKLGASTDVWPLGLIAFRLLTGFNYWKAANKTHPPIKEILFEVLVSPLTAPSERAKEYNAAALPKGFDAWFARAVVRNPGARFKDASEAFAALVPVLSSEEDEVISRPAGISDRETVPERPVAAAPMSVAPMETQDTGPKAAAALASKPLRAPPAESFVQTPRPHVTGRQKPVEDPGYVLANARASGVAWALNGDAVESTPDNSGGHSASTTGGVSLATSVAPPKAVKPSRVNPIVYVGGGVLVGVLLGGGWLMYSRAQRITDDAQTTAHLAAQPPAPPPPPPPEVPTRLRDVEQLASGDASTCARVAGAVWCWGANNHGQLGDGATTDRLLPVAVRGITDAVEVAVGGEHACARTSGAVKCWGANASGQLGDGSNTARTEAVAVRGLTTVAQLALGARHGCARTEAGAQSGGGSTAERNAPVLVRGVDATEITARDNHTCALLRNHSVRCWGQNAHGELGDGTATDHSTPTLVAGLSNAAHVALGARHGCAVMNDGKVRCWGSNARGQLGDTVAVGRPHAAEVPGLSGVAEIALGSEHSCARMSSGEVSCWGANGRGELGDGTTTERSAPAPALGGAAVRSIASGAEHVCALTREGTVRCFGRNEHGELGHGGSADSPDAVDVVRGR